MKWKEFTIHTTTEAEDLIVDMLSENGITGAEIRDNQQILDDDTMEIFEDVMPKQKEDDGTAEIVFYLDEDTDEAPVITNVLQGLENLKFFVNVGEGTLTRGETEDVDWINNWKAHFHAFYVDDILIKPTWLPMPEDAKYRMLLEIDPGTAFGTGSHETTKLCITALEKWLRRGDKVLDVGTGSGILSIVALKLGASEAFGTDIDPLAVSTAYENAAQNGVAGENFKAVLGDIITDPAIQEEVGDGKYDLVVANILADIIIPLQKEVVRHMRPGALLITSGIINLKEEAVRKALSANPDLEIIDETHLGEWCSFVARKKQRKAFCAEKEWDKAACLFKK